MPAGTGSPSQPQTPLRPTLRAARVEDYPQIERLESSHGLLTLAERDWRALWVDNPLRPRLGPDWPFGWVLEGPDHRIVGSLENLATLYTYRGQELIAVTGRGWVISSDYRPMALWLMDEYFNQNADLFINTTVNSLAVDAFGAFGSVRVPLGDWESAAFRVTGYRGFAAAALRIKGVPMPRLLAYPAATALWLKDVFSLQAIPIPVSSLTIEQAESFDARFDAFWQEFVRQNPNKLLAARDSQTLRWHFAGPMRQGQVWIFTASRNGLLRAYCILKRQDHPPSGLVRMRLVDHQTLEPDADHLTAMLSPAVRRCVAEQIHVIEQVGPGMPKMHGFERYAPYRRKLPAWPFYYHAADPVIQQELHNPLVWDPSTYDGDASL